MGWSYAYDLLDDLDKGGHIFKEFNEALKPTFPNSKRRFGDQKTINGKELFKWSAVFVNTCPDCQALHGQSKTMEEWKKIGLPRSGKTQCKKECKCAIVPDREPLDFSE